jgi:hypothetical protein
MKKLGSSIRRSVAALTLPFVMSACMTWQQQDVASLPDVIVRDQPDKVRLRTRSEGEFELANPRISGDTISGLSGSRRVVGVPLADVVGASLRQIKVASVLVIGGLVVALIVATWVSVNSLGSSGFGLP